MSGRPAGVELRCRKDSGPEDTKAHQLIPGGPSLLSRQACGPATSYVAGPGHAEVALIRDLGVQFPSVSAIRVRDAIDQVNKVFARIMTAVQVAGSVTLLAGALVLAGALATAQRRRIVEAVILKTIGARRRQILAAHGFEYALLAAIAAVVAIGLGTIVAWWATTQIMDVEFVFSVNAVFYTILGAGLLIASFGGLGTWAVLRARPVPYLRAG